MGNEGSSADQPLLDVREHENFERWYSNNILFQPTDIDLTMVFGELERRGNKNGVRQHTAMTTTWEQAKIMLYFLQLNIIMREIVVGKISIPRSLWPPVPPIPDGEPDEKTQALYEAVKALHEKFIQGL